MAEPDIRFNFVQMKDWINQYLVKTNIWVALCFTSLLAFFQLGLYQINAYVLGIVFFGTLAVYNFTRIENINDLFQFKSKLRTQILLTYIGLILTLLFVFLRGFELKVFLYLGVLGFTSFCYSLPFSGLGLRTIPFLKLFLIAFVWAGSSVGLLLVTHHELIHYKLLYFSVFFFVMGITISFDIRDHKIDEKELKTIPQVIGSVNSIILAVISLLFSALFFYLEFKTINPMIYTWWIAIIIALYFVLRSSEKRSFFYYSFWVESISLIPLIVFLLLKI